MIEPSPIFTVWICDETGKGTTHISSHAASDTDAASYLALQDCAAEWGRGDTDTLHVLGIAKGDVTILEWDDLAS